MKDTIHSTIRIAHLVVGGVVLIVFAVSGVYLRTRAPWVYLSDEVSHMMFRANHVYILMAGIANVAIGRYVTPAPNARGRLLQSIGVAAMTVSSVVLIYAFTMEPMLGSMDRPRTTIGVMLLALGTIFHVVSGISFKK